MTTVGRAGIPSDDLAELLDDLLVVFAPENEEL